MLEDELRNMLGSDPEFVIIKKIADLLPPDPKPTQKMLTQYRINDTDLKMLVSSFKETISDKIKS